MNTIVVAAFDTEKDAYEGLDALKDLDKNKDITLYATSIIAKSRNGEVEVKQAADKGPIGTVVGMLTGAVVGALGGPAVAATSAAAGAAAGTAAGGLGGLLFDVGSAGVDIEFLDDISAVLLPGKTAIIAEIDEDWVTPVDIKIGELGGVIFRRSRHQIAEDQLASESAALDIEAKEIRDELKKARAEDKAAAQKTLKSIQGRSKSVASKADAKLNQINAEAEAKTSALRTKMKDAKEGQKVKINKRIDEIKARHKARSKKLQMAKKYAREALAV